MLEWAECREISSLYVTALVFYLSYPERDLFKESLKEKSHWQIVQILFLGDIDVDDSDVGDISLSLKHFDFEISLQCLLCCFLEAFTKFLCNSPIHQANFSRHRLEGIKLEY